MLSLPQLAWFLCKRRRRRNNAAAGNILWYRFRAFDLPQGDGVPVSSVPNANGGSIVLASPSGGTPPLMVDGVLPNAQKALYFDPALGVTRLDFSQIFTATASTIIAVAKATNLTLGDQGLVICANTALYAVLPSFSDQWGAHVRDTVASGRGLDSAFKVITLRVNADASFDLFDMGTKVSFAAQAGSFPNRPGSSVAGDPSGVQQFQGYLAELQLYTSPLSDADIQTKVTELQTFYGI